jgi:hypothetical protein
MMTNGISQLFERPNLARRRRLLTCLVLVAAATRTALASVPPPDVLAAPNQVEIVTPHEAEPTSLKADRGIPDARRFPDLAFDTRRTEELCYDRAIVFAGKMSVESPQTGAQSIRFWLGNPGPTVFSPSRMRRQSPSLVDMRVKWQERKEWKAIEFASFHRCSFDDLP